MKEIRRKKTFGRVFYESYKKEFHIAGIALSIIAAITIIAISAVIFVKLGIFSGIVNFCLMVIIFLLLTRSLLHFG